MTTDAVCLRAAGPGDYEALDDLTVSAYLSAGLVAVDSPYVAQLRSAGDRARTAALIVATDSSGTLLGGVTFCEPGTRFAEIAAPDEAEFRMLVVAGPARGRGVGAALVGECAARARRLAGQRCRSLVCSVQDGNEPARRLYDHLGFQRLPGRHWSPAPSVRLLGYGLPLVGAGVA